MRIFLAILISIILVSCSIFRNEPILVGEEVFGKGRVYIYQKKNTDYLDFIFFYAKGKMKIEGLSIVGTPLFQLFISERTYLIVPKSNSYWVGELRELTMFYLKSEICERDLLSIFSGKYSSSLEIREFFKNSYFPKEIYWKGEEVVGRIKIKWVKMSSDSNLKINIPSSFKRVSLEEIFI